MPKKLELRLGQYLVQKQWSTLHHVNEALRDQARLRQRNENRPLGQLLMERGALDEETLKLALAELGVLRLRCEACKVEIPFSKYERGSAPCCQRCRAPLTLADPDQPADPPAAAPVELEGSPRAPRPDAPRTERPAGKGEEPPEAYIGKVLGGCQLLEKVGHGGMGIVYKAKQLNLGRIVAVKVLSGSLSRDETFVRRFLQEARSAAQLNHGNIVHVNDVGEHQGIYYFVMEYVDGRNLKEILKTCEQFEIPRAVAITVQVCQALRHAHSRNVIHRDIKPENILITAEGIVKVADLGLAKRMASDVAVGLTHAGSVLGTPYYMAPEQAKDFSRVDNRSDIYSLGVTLYKMLAGRVPFDGRSPIEVMIKAVDGRKTPLREIRAEVPPELERIVDKMMHRNPDQRYQDVDAVLEDLMRLSAPVPAQNRVEPAVELPVR